MRSAPSSSLFQTTPPQERGERSADQREGKGAGKSGHITGGQQRARAEQALQKAAEPDSRDHHQGKQQGVEGQAAEGELGGPCRWTCLDL